mgnify:CR=1 FL=1|jgi:hypothetical protein
MHISKNLIIKTLITLVVVCVVLISGALFLARDTDVVQCYFTGGSWQAQARGGAYKCGSEEVVNEPTDDIDGMFFEDRVYTDTIKFGCSCGSGRCWNGSECIGE